MSKLPKFEEVRDIRKHIDNGSTDAAGRILQTVIGASLADSKRIVELQTEAARINSGYAQVLNAFDTLWSYFNSLHFYDSELDTLRQQVQILTDQLQHVTNERDEYKSRLNAMRTTAGLEPLSAQNAAVDQLTNEAQRDGFYDNNLIQSIKDPEICALDSMVETLNDLNPEARCRVLDYLQRRFE